MLLLFAKHNTNHMPTISISKTQPPETRTRACSLEI